MLSIVEILIGGLCFLCYMDIWLDLCESLNKGWLIAHFTLIPIALGCMMFGRVCAAIIGIMFGVL